MKTSDFVTKCMTAAVNYPLETQWRIAVLAMVVICLLGVLIILPDMLEVRGIARVGRTFVPVIKVLRLAAGRRRDWRGALLDLCA
jgi:hypothetical protein